MRVVIVGQQDFGKATLDAFLTRGDTVAAVFCAPEKSRPDALRLAGEAAGIPTYRFPKLTDPEALDALRAANADVGIMAYVTQFVPRDFCAVRFLCRSQIRNNPVSPKPVAAASGRVVHELGDRAGPNGNRV